MATIKKGDYVLATKYEDGSPKDHFCVGFLDKPIWHGRHIVVDGNGASFRANGFRKIEKISKETGDFIVSNIKNIENGDKSLWDIFNELEKNNEL